MQVKTAVRIMHVLRFYYNYACGFFCYSYVGGSFWCSHAGDCFCWSYAVRSFCSTYVGGSFFNKHVIDNFYCNYAGGSLYCSYAGGTLCRAELCINYPGNCFCNSYVGVLVTVSSNKFIYIPFSNRHPFFINCSKNIKRH